MLRFRCPDTKIELISIRTLKTSHFRPLQKKQINADPSHWREQTFDNPSNNQIHFILHRNQVKFDPSYWNRVNLDHLHKMQANFACSHKKQVMLAPRSNPILISTTHTTKSISSPHWNQVKFDLAHWDHVDLNFDHHHKNHVNFHARAKNK